MQGEPEMRTDRDMMIQRWQNAMNRIGGPAALLGLPEQVKNVLKSTDDLTAKTQMLEAIADAMTCKA